MAPASHYPPKSGSTRATNLPQQRPEFSREVFTQICTCAAGSCKQRDHAAHAGGRGAEPCKLCGVRGSMQTAPRLVSAAAWMRWLALCAWKCKARVCEHGALRRWPGHLFSCYSLDGFASVVHLQGVARHLQALRCDLQVLEHVAYAEGHDLFHDESHRRFGRAP